MKSWFRNSLLIVLVVIIAIGYHPFFFDAEGARSGNYSSWVVIALLVLLFCSLLPRLGRMFASQFIRVYLWLLLIISADVLLLYGLGFNVQLSEIRTMVIPLVGLIIGYLGNYSTFTIRLMCRVYVLCMVFVGTSQILINIGGFIIEDVYKATAKNSLGLMLAIAGVVAVFESMYAIHKRYRILMLCVAILIFVELLVIRARLATVSYVAVLLLLFYKYFKASSHKAGLLACVFLLCIVLAIQGAFDIVYDSFMQNKSGDILSGRGVAYLQALNIIGDSPFWGNLTLNRTIAWVHNYLLLIASNFGLVGGLPWLILYFYILVVITTFYIKTNRFQFDSIGYVLMAVLFLVSLGEPTFPYGPGTAVLFPFILFGVSLKCFNKSKIEL